MSDNKKCNKYQQIKSKYLFHANKTKKDKLANCCKDCVDLTNREQFLKACHYTNLQPLWAKENLSKGAKIL